MDGPYYVESNNSACKHCGVGETWDVIGPDKVAESTTHGDLEAAQELADSLNRAYLAGQEIKNV